MKTDVEAAKLMMRRALWNAGGSTHNAARAMDISIPFMNYALRRLGLGEEAAMLRRKLRQRFRLP